MLVEEDKIEGGGVITGIKANPSHGHHREMMVAPTIAVKEDTEDLPTSPDHPIETTIRARANLDHPSAMLPRLLVMTTTAVTAGNTVTNTSIITLIIIIIITTTINTMAEGAITAANNGNT